MNIEKIKWKAWSAIAFIVYITVFNLYWGWGILFILWIIPDVLTKETYLFEKITRKESPITYWSVIALWMLVSASILWSSFSVSY